MYVINDKEVIDAITSDCRTFRAAIAIGDSIVYSGADIGAIDIEHTLTDDETIQMGNIMSRRVEIHLRAECPIKKGTVFRLYIYPIYQDGRGAALTLHRWLRKYRHSELAMYRHEQIAELGEVKGGTPIGGLLIPFGEYRSAKCTISGCMCEVVGYDKLRWADKPYEPNIPFPASSADVTDDILTQLGIPGRVPATSGNLLTKSGEKVIDSKGHEVLVSQSIGFVIDTAPVGKTCREVLGAIAAMSGGSGCLDRNGLYTEMIFTPYRKGGIRYIDTHMDDPELAEEDISLSGIRCVVDGKTELVCGDPDGAHAVEFICQYMTQERLNTIWQKWRGWTWRPAVFFERLADPRHDLGDNPSYHGLDVPITSLTYHFDGGLSADIDTCGNTESEV